MDSVRVSSRQYAVSRKILLSAYCLLPTAYSYADEIKDIKPPVDVPEPPWMLIIAALLGCILFGIAVWFWISNRRRAPVKTAIRSPWEIAYEQLEQLKKRDPFGKGNAKEHFIELSAIARRYIEERFNIRAPEMTTEEFLEQVKNASALASKQKEILKSFLQLCDMVKFAKYGPSAQEAIESFELIKRFVDETKQSNPEP